MLFLGLLFIIAYDNKFTLTIAFQIEKVKSQLSGRGGINGTRPIRSGRSMLSLILRGVQAFQIWKQNFDPWVGGDGLDMYQQLEGGFGSMRAILPIWGLGAKNGSKTENLKE